MPLLRALGTLFQEQTADACLKGGKIKQFNTRAHSWVPSPKRRGSPLRQDSQPAGLQPLPLADLRRPEKLTPRGPRSGSSARLRPGANAKRRDRSHRKGDSTSLRVQFPLGARPHPPPGPAREGLQLGLAGKAEPLCVEARPRGGRAQRGTAPVSDQWAREGARRGPRTRKLAGRDRPKQTGVKVWGVRSREADKGEGTGGQLGRRKDWESG